MAEDVSEDELGEEVESGEEEAAICSAIEKGADEVEITDKKGRKIRVKIKREQPNASTDDREGESF